MPPGKSFVELDPERGTLRVQAGIWFEEVFPLSEIVHAAPSTWPWYGGLGVKLGPNDSVALVGSLEGIVAVRFKRPQTMHVILAVHRTELRVSLEEPEAFIRVLDAARDKASQRASSQSFN